MLNSGLGTQQVLNKDSENRGPFSLAEADPGEAWATLEGVVEEPAFPRFQVHTVSLVSGQG